MSNLISLACACVQPLYHAYRAYSNIVEPARYKRFAENENIETCPIDEMTSEVFEGEPSLRRDIVIYHNDGHQSMAAVGGNFGPAAFIVYNPDLNYTGNYESIRFGLKHELSHIKNSDVFISESLAVVASSLSTLAVPYIQAFLPPSVAFLAYFVVPHFVGSVTRDNTMQVFENRADDFAISYATDAELIGAGEHLLGRIEAGQNLHRRDFRAYNSRGNLSDMNDPTHPTDTDRLQKIEAALRVRGLNFKDECDDDLVEAEKDFILAKYAQ